MPPVDTARSHVLWPSTHEHTSTQQEQQQHLAALQQHSIRAALIRLLLLLYFRVPLEQHSSTRACLCIFSSMAYCTAEKSNTGSRSHDHLIYQAQRAREKHKHGVANQSPADEHSTTAAAAAVVAPSGTRATLLSSRSRTPAVAVYFSAVYSSSMKSSSTNLGSTAVCVVAAAATYIWENKIFEVQNTKVRVRFQGPG